MLETLGLLPAVAGVNHDGVSSRAFGEKGFEYDGRTHQLTVVDLPSVVVVAEFLLLASDGR